MAKNIVYLIGAGASYNCLPIVSDMHVRMSLFIKIFKEAFPEFSNFIDNKYSPILNEIKKSTTPDVFAKTLFLKLSEKNQELSDLKILLSSYMMFEQLEKAGKIKNIIEDLRVGISKTNKLYESYEKLFNTMDSRYTNFLCKLLEDEIAQMPKNISILTWNYDIQFELAIQKIKNFNFNQAQQFLKVNSLDTNAIIYRLNGIGLIYNNEDILLDIFHSKSSDDVNKLFLEILNNHSISNYQNKLFFAWEKNNEFVEKTRINALKKIKNADVLVVIGYSFPDFNRKIDEQILKSINANKNYIKIYIQDPNANIILNKINEIRPGISKVCKIANEDLSNFYLPNEFWWN
ncbi:MAG: hypothetical protein ACK4IK_07140 [Bacteroidia bacterium]